MVFDVQLQASGEGSGRGVEGIRILLVDDYPDALDMWGLYLRSLGYEVTTASDGRSAIDAALAQRPDVIIMDLELPVMSGFDAARQLRSDPRTAEVPLIAATGYSHAKQLDQAREAGFDAIVVKPCEPSTLAGEIERLLAAKSPARGQDDAGKSLPA